MPSNTRAAPSIATEGSTTVGSPVLGSLLDVVAFATDDLAFTVKLASAVPSSKRAVRAVEPPLVQLLSQWGVTPEWLLSQWGVTPEWLAPRSSDG